MTIDKLSKAVKDIREKLLKMTQQELAKEMNTQQNMVSRFEKGSKGTIQFFIDFTNLLKKKGYNHHMILVDPFDIEYMIKDNANSKEYLKNSISYMQENINEDLNKIKERIDLL